MLDQTNTEHPNQKNFCYVVDEEKQIYGLPSLFLGRQKEYEIEVKPGSSFVVSLCSELCNNENGETLDDLEMAATKNNDFANCKLYVNNKLVLNESVAKDYRTTIRFDESDKFHFGPNNPFHTKEGDYLGVVDGIFAYLIGLKEGDIIEYSIDQAGNEDLNHREKNKTSCKLIKKQ